MVVSLNGSQRDHAFSVMHLIEVARGKIDGASRLSVPCQSAA